MFTTPLARPTASVGVKERARSKPTVEAGPPVAVTQIRTTMTGRGAGPGHVSTTAQTTLITATIPSTMRDRWNGNRPTAHASTGPLTRDQPTASISRPLASWGLSP